MPNDVRRYWPFAALLTALVVAEPARADDWETCAKSSGDDAIAAAARQSR